MRTFSVYRQEDLRNELKIPDISILSAQDVNFSLLFDFYKVVYPQRINLLSRMWTWLYRSSFYDNKIPLVAVYNNRVIAHAGMIPFYVSLDGKRYTASWFIDFAVLPEFQKRGIGTLLTRQWMGFSDVCVEIGHNKGSWRVFKKLGWIEFFDTHLHLYSLMPFNYPKFRKLGFTFLRNILNMLSFPFLYIIYHKYAYSITKLRFDALNIDSLDKFKPSLNVRDDSVVPIRDDNYISWRLLNSPDKDKYLIASIDNVDGVRMIIKLCNKVYCKYIDLLWVSDSSKYSVIRRMISTLSIWALNKGYSYIRHLTLDKELANLLRKSLKPIVRHPNFAFYSKDSKLLEKLKYSNWHWELIDNDFEEF